MTPPPASNRRAVIREADLRRFARISSREGVTIQSRVDPDGGITITIHPSSGTAGFKTDNLDARLAAFGAS